MVALTHLLTAGVVEVALEDLVAGPVHGRALVDAAAALAGRAPAPGPGHAPGRRAGGPAQGPGRPAAAAKVAPVPLSAAGSPARVRRVRTATIAGHAPAPSLARAHDRGSVAWPRVAAARVRPLRARRGVLSAWGQTGIDEYRRRLCATYSLVM